MEMDIPWVGKQGDPNPLRAKVVRCYETAANKYELEMQLDSGELRRMSLFGDNRNRCCATWGMDEKKWPGRTLTILTEEKVGEKKKRVLSPL